MSDDGDISISDLPTFGRPESFPGLPELAQTHPVYDPAVVKVEEAKAPVALGEAAPPVSATAPLARPAKPEAPQSQPSAVERREERPALGYGEEDEADKTIADVLLAHGTGKVVVPPDSVCVELSVAADGETAEAARDKGARNMEAFLAAVKGLNVTGLVLKTESMRTYPVHERHHPRDFPFGDERMPKVVGFQARGSVTATLRQGTAAELAASAARVMDAASKAGASIGGLSFELDHPETAADQALALAVASAKRMAAVMAQAAGVGLGKLHSLREAEHGGFGHKGFRGLRTMAASMSAAPTPTPVEAGDITVARRVVGRWWFAG
jgi:uncharacterized protein YggE